MPSQADPSRRRTSHPVEYFKAVGDALAQDLQKGSDLKTSGLKGVREINLGGDVDKHHGLGLAAEGVLQQLRQLGVAEGHMLGVVRGQRRHHVPERAQTPVYVLCLLQPLPRRLTFSHPLAAWVHAHA